MPASDRPGGETLGAETLGAETLVAETLGAEMVSELVAVLGRAQQLGFIGKGADLGFEVAHSVRFGKVAFECFGGFAGIGDAGTGEVSCLDIGSGGGLPALAVALGWQQTHWTLCEISANRCDFLEWAVRRLELDARVNVVEGSVYELAGNSDHAGEHELVTARAFAPISKVLGVSVDLLAHGGLLLVSDPPDGQQVALAQEGVARQDKAMARLEACGSYEGISVFRK